MKELQKKGYVLTDEGSLSTYPSLHINHHPDGKLEITQPAFIERIINSMKLKDNRMHDTPADKVLHADHEAPARKMNSIINQ